MGGLFKGAVITVQEKFCLLVLLSVSLEDKLFRPVLYWRWGLLLDLVNPAISSFVMSDIPSDDFLSPFLS